MSIKCFTQATIYLSSLALCVFTGCPAASPQGPYITYEIASPAATTTSTSRPTPKPTPTPTPSPKPTPTTASVLPPAPDKHFTLRDGLGRPIEVYPPNVRATPDEKSKLVVFLHATCMEPAGVCDWFGAAGKDKSWLVCPSGNSTCYGAPDWEGLGSTKTLFLEQGLAQVEKQIASFVDPRPGVLMGWSRGAYAARDILNQFVVEAKDKKPSSLLGKFCGVVLLAAAIRPSPYVLKSVGITRVVMAAGDMDGSRPTMMASIAELKAHGLAARYVSLGKIGHLWPEDFETRMAADIAWAQDC